MPSSFRQEETWWSRVLFPFFSAAILVPPSHGVAVVLAAFSRPCEVPVKLWLFYPFLCNVPPGVPSLGECAWALSLIEWPTLWLMESSPRQVFDPLPPPQGGPFLWELLAALSHPDPGGTFLSLGQRQMSLCLEAQCSLPQIWAVILLSSRHYTQLPIRQAFPLPADTQDPIILEIQDNRLVLEVQGDLADRRICNPIHCSRQKILLLLSSSSNLFALKFVAAVAVVVVVWTMLAALLWAVGLLFLFGLAGVRCKRRKGWKKRTKWRSKFSRHCCHDLLISQSWVQY